MEHIQETRQKAEARSMTTLRRRFRRGIGFTLTLLLTALVLLSTVRVAPQTEATGGKGTVPPRMDHSHAIPHAQRDPGIHHSPVPLPHAGDRARLDQVLGHTNTPPPSNQKNLQPNGGYVMNYTYSYAIYWLPSGYTFEPNGSDSRYENLIDRFLSDVGGSPYHNTLIQYGVQNWSSFTDVYVDPRPFPETVLSDADIQQEVSYVIQARGWTPGGNSTFFVFTPVGVESCSSSTSCTFHIQGLTDDQQVQYCAYHSSFQDANGTPIIYANMPSPYADSQHYYTGCFAQDSAGNYLQPNGDAYADSEISTLAHEQAEMITDPFGGSGWYNADEPGLTEIGDKCNGYYGTIDSDGGNVTMPNGDRYILQGLWSNNANGSNTIGACSWGS